MASADSARTPGSGRSARPRFSRLESQMARIMSADEPVTRAPAVEKRKALGTLVAVLLWAALLLTWGVHDLPLMLEFDTRRKRLLSSSARCFIRTRFDRNQEARCRELLNGVWIPLYPNRYRQPVARWPKPDPKPPAAMCVLDGGQAREASKRPAERPVDDGLARRCCAAPIEP